MPYVRSAVLLFVLSDPAAADESPALSEQEFYAPLPVVLTASRLAQSLDEAPAAVTVLDRQLIAASGARNLSELFRLVPGFTVALESGHRHVVTHHGLADQFARRLQVLIDGRSVYLPSFGGVSWSDLPLALEDIERIEVIRGPNAATYGANAFLATISITTRHAAAEPGGYLGARVGTGDIRDGVLRSAGGGEGAQYRLTAGYQADRGYTERNDSREITLFNGRLDVQLGERADLEYQFGYNGGPRGRGYEGSLFNWPHDQQITSRFQQLRWRQRLGDGDELLTQVYHNHHESDEQILSLPIAYFGGVRIPLNFDVRSERYDAELQYLAGLGERLRLAAGGGARLDRVLWPGYLGLSEWVDHRHYRAFGSLEWRATGRLTVNAGGMYEHSAITGADFSPRIAANYQLQPGHTLRLAASRATRQPVLIEEQSNAVICVLPDCSIYDQVFLSSGGLEPERIVSTELGYLVRPAPALTLDLRLFRDQLDRLIGMYTREKFPDMDHDTRDFRNLDKVTLTGGELQLDWRPQPTTRLLASYANVKAASSNLDAAYTHTVPRQTLALLGLRELGGGWQASAAYYYQDRIAYLDEDDEFVGPLRRVDLRLAWRFALPGAAAETALVLQHPLKEQDTYYVDYADSVARRTGYLTLGLQMR